MKRSQKKKKFPKTITGIIYLLGFMYNFLYKRKNTFVLSTEYDTNKSKRKSAVQIPTKQPAKYPCEFEKDKQTNRTTKITTIINSKNINKNKNNHNQRKLRQTN